MADGQVPFTGDHHSEEDGAAEGGVVEGVGELRDQVQPYSTVLRPRPVEH